VGISAREAGELAGVGKGAILRSIKTGRMSAQKDVKGEWDIDVAELGREYTIHTPNGTPEYTAEYTANAQDTPREVALMREMLNRQDEVIADLRQRLDASQAQVDHMAAVIAQLSPPQARKGWWARLLGGA